MRSSLLNLTAVVAPLLLGGAACSASVVADGADANTTSSHTLLVVEQSVGAGTGETEGESVRSRASVWFLRAGDGNSLAEAALLVRNVLEIPGDGECVVLGPPLAPQVEPTLAVTELAFAGDVTIESEGSTEPLVVRAFPDVADLVSGVVYTARRQTGFGLPTGSMFTLRATGATDFAPFEAQAEAPAAPSELAIDGTLVTAEPFELTRRAFTISWKGDDKGDIVYLDVDPVPGSINDRVRCALSDTGSAVIPEMAVPESPQMMLSLHRVREVPLRSADTTEVGMAHFDLSVSTQVRIALP